MTSRQDLIDSEAKIEAYLTHLAVDKTVAPSTQNQAMNALVFYTNRYLRGLYFKITFRELRLFMNRTWIKIEGGKAEKGMVKNA